MKEIIFLNGKFISKDEAKISVITPGVLCGFGLFETMRAYNKKIVYFYQHLKRIQRSSWLIGMRFPYSLTRLKDIINKTIKINKFKDAYVRLTLWKTDEGLDTLIVVKKYEPYLSQKYRKGFSVNASSFKQDENSFLAGLKTTNRLLYELSFKEAKFKGFDEALILNNRGYVTEGTRSNIFLIKDKTIFTPPLSSGCLGGITRRVIFDLAKRYNIKIYEVNFTLFDLCCACEAFLTNSLIGVMPLASIEKRSIGKDRVGKMTKFFMDRYNLLLRNGT